MNKVSNMVEFLIQHSCEIKKDDIVYINFFGIKNEFLERLEEKLKGMQVEYILKEHSNRELNDLLKEITVEKALDMAKEEESVIKKCSVHISLIAEEIFVDTKYTQQYIIYQNYYKRVVRDLRLKYCRWIGIRLPTVEMANIANMDFQSFEKIYYNACTVDYLKMEKDSLNLAYKLGNTKEIKIITPTTNLTFQKKGIAARILCGKINLPDGEIYTAPEKYSVNGIIAFNTTSIQAGEKFENITLEFEKGKIIKAECNNTNQLNIILDSDKGSRYIGEFAIGINDNIKKPIGIILFDEKIMGTVHFAIGQSYKDAYNGNDSAVHWDLVLNMNKEAGGGSMFFDNELVFKDGVWLI